jgi:dynein heavy chain
MVEGVNKRLEECTNNARVYNHREGLFNMDITDYSQLHSCAKEFKPYSDLWLTTRTWFNRHQAWLTDEWDDLDGNEIETTVDNSAKTLSTCLRYFRNKDMQSIL